MRTQQFLRQRILDQFADTIERFLLQEDVYSENADESTLHADDIQYAFDRHIITCEDLIQVLEDSLALNQ